MKKYLILIKHSLPEIVENMPAREWKLSDDGRLRARRLADRLISYQPEVIVSSIEPKAQQTAEIIAARCALVNLIVDGLHEHDRSKTTFLSKDEFQESIRLFFEKPDTLVFGEETADDCHTRFNRAVSSLLNYYADKIIAVVAHGTVISLFVSRLTGISDFFLWNELGLPSFVVLDMDMKSIVAKENIV
jgi:broad specificity phosphatase PhoE